MSEQVFYLAFVGGLLLSVLALIVGIWMRPAKGPPGWLMAVSTIFFVIGVGGLAWVAYRGPGSSHNLTLSLAFPVLTIAVVLFATGYLWDRIRRCKSDTWS